MNRMAQSIRSLFNVHAKPSGMNYEGACPGTPPEPPNIELANIEPANIEPANIEPAKIERANIDPVVQVKVSECETRPKLEAVKEKLRVRKPHQSSSFYFSKLELPQAEAPARKRSDGSAKVEVLDSTFQAEKRIAEDGGTFFADALMRLPAYDDLDQTDYTRKSLEHKQARCSDVILVPPSDYLYLSSWPKTYMPVSVMLCFIMPFLGVIALGSSCATRKALQRGQLVLATERSQNTKVIVIYSLAIFGIAVSIGGLTGFSMWMVLGS